MQAPFPRTAPASAPHCLASAVSDGLLRVAEGNHLPLVSRPVTASIPAPLFFISSPATSLGQLTSFPLNWFSLRLVSGNQSVAPSLSWPLIFLAQPTHLPPSTTPPFSTPASIFNPTRLLSPPSSGGACRSRAQQSPLCPSSALSMLPLAGVQIQRRHRLPSRQPAHHQAI